MERKNNLQEDLDEYAFWLRRVLNDRLLRDHGQADPQKPVLRVDVLTVTLSSPKRGVSEAGVPAFDEKNKKITQEV